MSKIVTFGEIMLRLAPNGYYRFFQDDQFLRISAVVVRVLESIIWRKAQASAEVFVFMIERVLQYRLQAEEILTGVEYLREQNGFILPELLRL